MKYLPKTELEIIGKKGYLTDRGVLKIVIYKDEKDFERYKEVLEILDYKEGDRGDYIIWSNNKVSYLKGWLQFGEDKGCFKIADLKKRKLADLKRKKVLERKSQEAEFKIIKKKGYLTSGGKLKVITYEDEEDFDYYKKILESVGYKREDRGDYIIWSDDRIKEVKEWLRVGEEQGYFKVIDLKRRKITDLKRKDLTRLEREKLIIKESFNKLETSVLKNSRMYYGIWGTRRSSWFLYY